MSNSEKTPGTDSNPDPITGAPGSHPLGTGIGAASGAATGAAVGAVGGPVGALVGGAIGAVTGGYVGKGVEEHYDPTAEDAYWAQNHGTQSFAKTSGRGYEDYQTAYTTGHQAASEHAGRTFDDVKDTLKAGYEKTTAAATLPWDHAKEATRAAFDRVGEQREILLKEEQLKVGKREVAAGEVQIRKTVHSETVNTPVELRHEDVTIERVSASEVRPGTAIGNFQEETIDVPLTREEAVVSKEAHVTGAVRVAKTAIAETQTVSETVRKEEVEVTRDGKIVTEKTDKK